MGCVAAKSLSQYVAVLPSSSEARLPQETKQQLETPAPENEVPGKISIPRHPELSDINFNNHRKAMVALPRLSISPNISRARLQSPILVSNTKSISPPKESSLSSPLKPERRRNMKTGSLRNLILTVKGSENQKASQPFLTLEAAVKSNQLKENLQRSFRVYCKPIDFHSHKFVRKVSSRPFSKLGFGGENDSSRLEVSPLECLPKGAQKPEEFTHLVEKGKPSSPSKSIDNAQIEFNSSLAANLKREANRFRTRVRGSIGSLKDVTKQVALSSRSSLNQESIYSGSTGLPLIQLKSKAGRLERRRPSLALTPEGRTTRTENRDTSLVYNENPLHEDSFAEKFRQTRMSIKGTQRQTRKERIFSPDSKFSKDNPVGKSPHSKVKRFDFSYIELIEAQPIATKAIATFAPSNKFLDWNTSRK